MNIKGIASLVAVLVFISAAVCLFPFPKQHAVKAGYDEFLVVIRIDTKADIRRLIIDYGLNGNILGGGCVSDARGKKLSGHVSHEYMASDFNGESPNGFFIKVYVSKEGIKEDEDLYDSMNHIGFIQVSGVFSYDASYGSTYYYSLKGDYTKGFYIEKAD